MAPPFRALGVLLALLLPAQGSQPLAQEASRSGLPSRKVPVGPGIWPPGGRTYTEILAFTWDGRLALYTGEGPTTFEGVEGRPVWTGWWASLLRPEAVERAPDGLPDFRHAFSRAVLAAPDADPERRTGYPEWEAHQTLQHWHLSLAPDPAWTGLNPHPSDALGNTRDPGPDTRHATYRIAAVGPLWGHEVEEDGISHSMRWARLGFRRLRVVVADPGTAGAEIVHTETVSPMTPFTWEDKDGETRYLLGEEPTMTADGRLLLWKGRRRNNALRWMEGNGRTAGDMVQWSANETPFGLDGWTRPRNLSELYEHRNMPLGGLTLGERYPIARERLRLPDGTELDAETGSSPEEKWAWGAYPWVGQNGRILMYPLVRLGDPVEAPNARGARRCALMVVGPMTNWVMRVLDGPINSDREITHRVISASPGLAPGMWDLRVGTGAPLPATPLEPVMPIWNIASQNTYNYDDDSTWGSTGDFSFYSEVSLEDGADPDCVLSLHMNESVRIFNEIGTVHYEYDPLHTPDVTNRTPRNGRLVGDAGFPLERHGRDELCGRVGQAVQFGARGSVVVEDHADLQPTDAFSLRMFVKADVADPDAAFSLARHGERFHLELVPGGVALTARLANGHERRVEARPVPGQEGGERPWFHLAWTYRADDGAGRARTRLFADGELLTEVTWPAMALATDPGAELVIGPAGSGPEDPGDLCRIDELALHRVELTPEALWRFAYRPPLPASSSAPAPSASGDGTPPRPLGLERAVAQVPADNPTTAAKATLGRRLFFDPGLSADGSISCATCHDPRRSFTQHLAHAEGLEQRPFNAPTLINRAFSTRQTWNGRAASLEEQAAIPLFHPSEMGGDPDALGAYLAAEGSYAEAFAAAGLAPDERGVRHALAAFQRTLLSGDSLFDRRQAGRDAEGRWTEEHELGLSVFHGKGNCFGCHAGPNFTDERLHNTGSSLRADGDPGAFAVTGLERDRGAFKTPTLRDVALTAPYMHDGSLENLMDVVEFYDRGGHLAPLPAEGDPPAIQGVRDLEMLPLGLSAAEKRALVTFLEALTGSSLDRSAPPEGDAGG